MSVWPIPIEFSVAGFLFPLAVAIALGLLFSYFPAMSAARIKPSEALRDG
jgi:ABC-type antimicrobial peptide transport system permease subunit